MKVGVRFCGGCNSRYDRGLAYQKIKAEFNQDVLFDFAKENEKYDILLVIGGCTNCCASYEQYIVKHGVIKLYDLKDLDKTIKIINDFI